MPSCYFCTFRDSIMSIYHCMDNYVPGLYQYAEMSDVMGLFAPKPVVIVGRQGGSHLPNRRRTKGIPRSEAHLPGGGRRAALPTSSLGKKGIASTRIRHGRKCYAKWTSKRRRCRRRASHSGQSGKNLAQGIQQGVGFLVRANSDAQGVIQAACIEIADIDPALLEPLEDLLSGGGPLPLRQDEVRL